MKLPGNSHMLSLKSLSIGYEGHGPLLSNINLHLESGELVALIGKNGSGKSTLIRSLVGLQPVLEGNCYLEGFPVHSMNLQKRARRVSYVSARTGPMPAMTVRELVSLGRMPHTDWRGRLRKPDQDLVHQALRAVLLQEMADRTMDQLSDGERQRAMIARAVAQDAPLMVLDEPTAFLDLAHKYEFIQLLSTFRGQGKAILYSTHDLESALMVADRLWVISGREIKEGAPEDLGMKGVFEALFQSSGITFDVESRRFRRTGKVRGSLRLTGHETVALAWTRNALERLGYEVRHEGDRELQVRGRGSEREWILVHEQGKKIFKSISSLARFLIEEN